MRNIFDIKVTQEIIDRVNTLNPDSLAIWGKMNASQMLAHCNVTYAMLFDNNYKNATGLKKWIIKTFIKPVVLSEKPFKKNSPTSGYYKMREDKDFDVEKKRLLDYLDKTQKLGAAYFEGKESVSFGELSSKEWNTIFYKHLDHHLNQFGV
jgi:hypothetical protein